MASSRGFRQMVELRASHGSPDKRYHVLPSYCCVRPRAGSPASLALPLTLSSVKKARRAVPCTTPACEMDAKTPEALGQQRSA